MLHHLSDYASKLGRGCPPVIAATIVILAGWSPSFAQGQGGGIAVGNAINPEVFPLNLTTVPDINVLGLLDKTGTNAGLWPWDPITNEGKQLDLQILGKALFWDMQVGGDGIQACASCHYHAGADHRKVNQMSPGLKADDNVHELGTNYELITADFEGLTNGLLNGGFPVSEPDLEDAGALPDLVDGSLALPNTPAVKADNSLALVDLNDVASSQGVRAGTHDGVSNNRVDTATLDSDDDQGALDPSIDTFDHGFNHDFPEAANAAGIPDTVRRVEPRNAPTVLNAVYNHRNFWDGRGDSFFNAENPLGFRDPDARVKVYDAVNGLDEERLNLPFSALASQAVGPIGSNFEMVFTGRPISDLGKKLVGAQPLRGQLVACDDSKLRTQTDCTTPGTTNRGLELTYGTYGERIADIFHSRFWDYNGCFDVDGNNIACGEDDAYTLMEYNFALFFGLAVQAYEATLFTEETIVDLIGGGIATGTVTNGLNPANRNFRSVDVGPPGPDLNGLPLEACIAALARNNRPAEQALAEQRCAEHYQKFIHPGAHSGSESNIARFPTLDGVVPTPNMPIGGCPGAPACEVGDPEQVQNGINTILNVDRGLGRFFAGATGCGVCHFNPEFNGATVQAITGFGAGPIGILPPGQVAREVEEPVVAERMITFNGAPAVYDAGFYNIGVRPTPEDISLGGQSDGVPLSLAKFMEVIAGGNADGLNAGKINDIFDAFFDTNGIIDEGELAIPTSPTDLTPVPWALNVACGPGLNNPNANNNPNAQCVPDVIPGERLLRNGAFKAQGLRNAFLTGPYLHNGSKMNLRQVLEFYKTAGHFVNLNLNNLDAGMRIFNLGVADEATVIELMEIGLTDWRVAYEEGKFDHPELCIPHGHHPDTGETILVGIPAVGASGNNERLQTFEEQLRGEEDDLLKHHNFDDPCTVEGITSADSNPISSDGLSNIDVPPPPPPI